MLRKPCQAGSGRRTRCWSGWSAWSTRSRNEPCQPGLRASTVSNRRMASTSPSGRYSSASVADEEGRHPWLLQAEPDPVARRSRLGHLELGFSDAVPVADAHRVVRQPVDGEVLPEVAPDEIGAGKCATPVLVGLGLVHPHRAPLAAVAVE